MVTTDEEEPQPVGAIAAFGGHVQDVIAEGTRRVTYGEPTLLTPLLLIVLLIPTVLLQTDVWVAALGMAALLALTVWCVVTVTRAKR
jgi:hypothetical protein